MMLWINGVPLEEPDPSTMSSLLERFVAFMKLATIGEVKVEQALNPCME